MSMEAGGLRANRQVGEQVEVAYEVAGGMSLFHWATRRMTVVEAASSAQWEAGRSHQGMDWL